MKLIHSYVESEVELVKLDIKNDTIIYQGESHWVPEKVGSSKKYKLLAEGWYRAGIKAQELFKVQAKKENLILEELFQDQKSFKSYTNTAKSVSIKRGDFLIRNIRNLEIEWMEKNHLEMISVKGVGKCFQVPVSKIDKGFELLNKFKV